MASATLLLALFARVALAPAATTLPPTPRPLCDGTPPELVNRDTRAYGYELACNAAVTKGVIEPGAKKSLKGYSGCRLKLGSNPPVKLHTEMVCTIERGTLSCDLL